jgi:hypothetical protein
MAASWDALEDIIEARNDVIEVPVIVQVPICGFCEEQHTRWTRTTTGTSMITFPASLLSSKATLADANPCHSNFSC